MPKGIYTRQQPARDNPRGDKATAVGRDGEVLTRKRTSSTDMFHVPPEVIPAGWDYQWNVQTVTGEPAIDAQLAMAENGWRPVPAGRHKGMFMKADHPENGEILRGGLRLEERPMTMTEEAREEELASANRQVRDNADMFKGRMPDGFSRDNPNLARMERAGTKRTYAPEPGLARPALPIEN